MGRLTDPLNVRRKADVGNADSARRVSAIFCVTRLGMINHGFLKMMLHRPPLTGVPAIVFSLAAVACPTLLHAVVNSSGIGLAFIIYVPSVMLAALFLRPWQTALVAVACAAAGDWFFLEQSNQITFSDNDLIGVPIFLLSSALIIGVVQAIRKLVHETFSPHAEQGQVIFSEEKGHAWAHWRGDRPSVPLGQHDEVAEMMEDYLAQVELGERLTAVERKSRRA